MNNIERKNGFAHILMVVFILAAIGAGYYLATHSTVFKSKASGSKFVTSGVAQAGDTFEPRPGVSCALEEQQTACMDFLTYGYPCQILCCGYAKYSKGNGFSCSANAVEKQDYSLTGSKISAKCVSRSTDYKCVTVRVTWDKMGDFISGESKWYLVRADETRDSWNGPRNVKPILSDGSKNLDSAAWNQKKGDNFVDLDISGGKNFSIQVQGFITDRTDDFYSDNLATNVYNESYAQKELKRIGQITLFSDLIISDIGMDGIKLEGSEIGVDCLRRDSGNKCNRVRVKWDNLSDLFMQKYVSWYLLRADDQKDGWKGPDDVAVWNANNRDRFVEFDVNPNDTYYVSIQGFYSDRNDEKYSDSLGIYTYWDSYYTDGGAKLDKAQIPRQTKRIGNVTLFNNLMVDDL